MKNRNLVLAGVAVAFLSSGLTSAFAQDEPIKHHAKKATDGYRPLTVAPKPALVTGPADVLGGIGAAVASPFNAIGATGGPIGAGGAVIGDAVGGATSLAVAPLQGLFGGQVGISAMAAPPLPIKARYANTGAVQTSFDEGFSQDVPVDKSGPIYMIDNTGHDRVVTPFSLVAFPLTAATSVVTSPFRPVAPHP